MFSIQLSEDQVYNHLGLYKQNLQKLNTLTQLQYETAEKFRHIINHFSKKEGGITRRKLLLRDIATGIKPKLNTSTLTTENKRSKEFRDGRRQFNLVIDSGSDFYDGIVDDIDFVSRSGFILPNFPGVVKEQIYLITIDHPLFIKNIPSQIAILRDVLDEHMVTVGVNGVDYEDPIIVKYFRKPFVIYEHTKFRKFDIDNVVIVNKTGKPKNQILDKFKLSDDAVFISCEIFDVIFQPQHPHNGDIRQYIRIKGDIEHWRKRVGDTFKDHLEELFVAGYPIMNSTTQIRLHYKISDITPATIYDDQLVCLAKLNNLRDQCMKSKSLVRMNILGSKGSGKSLLARLINERGIPGITRRIICVDSDAYGKWRMSTRDNNDTFNAISMINIDTLEELTTNNDIISIFEDKIRQLLMEHNIAINEHTNTIKYIMRLNLDTLSQITNEFKQFYLDEFKNQCNFYDHLCGNIPDAENTLLITFIHTTVETSAAPGTNINFSLHTIFYPLQALIDRNRDLLVNFILNKVYEEMGTDTFTKLRPCDIWM